MHPNVYLSPLAFCLTLAIALPAKGAEPISLQDDTLKHLSQQFHIALPGVKHALGSSQVDTLQFVQQHKDVNKVTHVRLQQHYEGFFVYGGYAILHSAAAPQTLLAAPTAVRMTGVVYEGLKAELGKPSADFVKKGEAALQQFKASSQGKAISEESVTPMVYIDENHTAHWAYKVSFLIVHHDQIPERPTAILDATTYRPFIQWNDIKTGRTMVKGIGYGGNHRTGQLNYDDKERPLLDLTRESWTGKCYMETRDVRVVDMLHEYYSLNRPMQFACKQSSKNPKGVYWTGYRGDGYDRDNGAYSPTNDALYDGYVIKHMYLDWYNVDVLTKKDGSPMQLIMRVHYGDGYENAYWDGKQMTFGDGESMMYPLVSLGVGAHEISHGFTEQHSSLEYIGQSGGLNESFSDMASQAAEFYSEGKTSWKVGHDIMKEDSGYETLRYMDLPSKDGTSIDTADNYYDGLDVHYSSGVYNRLFYLMSTHEGWDPRKTFDVMVKANMDYWTPYATFNEAACGVLSAADDLGFSTLDVKQSMDMIAVHYDACK